MPNKLHVKKGDNVMVIAGDYKGTKGKVLAVYPEKMRALVEGVNIIHKHSKPSASNTKGGIVKKEAPIHISNIMLIDPTTGNPTRIGRRLNEKNKLVRFAVKSKEEIK
jgi:large subunit ribosomal protein L24